MATGYVCCDQTDYFTLTLPASKRLRVEVSLASSSSSLRAVLVQRDSCPTGDLSLCTSSLNCFFNTTPSASSYTILTPLSMVHLTSSTKWCVGIKALPKSDATNEASYAFTNMFVATPNPTPTPEPSYDPCAVNSFCDRTLVQASTGSRIGVVVFAMVVGVVSVVMTWM